MSLVVRQLTREALSRQDNILCSVRAYFRAKHIPEGQAVLRPQSQDYRFEVSLRSYSIKPSHLPLEYVS